MIKGILEQITTSTVNLVNADLLAKNRGLRIRETFVSAEGKVGLSYLSLKHRDSILYPDWLMAFQGDSWKDTHMRAD